MITILDSGIQTEQDQLQYLWFKVQDLTANRRYFRVVALSELASVPVSIREDYDLLQKQWAAVRGLYNAKADFVYSAAGIFTPEHVGVVQYYGGAGTGESRDEAARVALNNLGAVRATLANYEQSRLAQPTPAWIEWYLDFITRRSRNIMALLGHPDPRATRRGLGKDGELANDTGDDLAAEQNELLFRGLAKLREDFIFQVTAKRVGRKHLAEGLVRVAQIASNVASRRRGSIHIGFSLSIPIAMALSSALAGSRSGSDSNSHTSSEGQSHGWGNSHTESSAHTESRSSTTGETETHGIAIGHTDAAGSVKSHAQTLSQAHTDSQAHSESRSHTDSSSLTTSESTSAGHSANQGSSSNWSSGQSSNWSQGQSNNWSEGQSNNWSQGESNSWSQGESDNWSQGSSQTASQSATESAANTVNASINGGVNLGADAGIGDISPLAGKINGGVHLGGAVGAAHTEGSAISSGSAEASFQTTGGGSSVSIGSGQSASVGGGSSSQVGGGLSNSVGGGVSQSVGGGVFQSESNTFAHTKGKSTTIGSANSYGSADTLGSADTRGNSDTDGYADSISSADSIVESHSWSKSRSFTQGSADTVGKTDGQVENWGRSHTESDAFGTAVARAAGSSFSGGFSTGLVPGVSIARAWQTEDDVADRLTELLRQFEGQLNTASAEGGFMTDAVLFTASDLGQSAARALIPQAFHGPNVPTPVLTLQPTGPEAEEIRDHALAFLHYPGWSAGDPLGGYLFTRYATLLHPGQLAAYTAPGLFEEGTAMTALAPIPKGMSFYPAMSGEVLIGHQFSPETAELTTAPVRLELPRLMHTLFAGDTGWGKSVAAITVAHESTLHWKTRTVVLDFGAGWRQLLNAPHLQGRVDILQLWPDAVRPFRWNPLQIGRNINPETQWRAFADIFGSIARLGVRRQKQELLQALRNVYLRSGVLIDDPVVRADPEWGRVRDPDEAERTGANPGTPLSVLTREARQALAVQRSLIVGLADLYAEVQHRLAEVPPRDTTLAGVLEGILFRLNPLVQGAAASQFTPGPAATALEDLARPWGITIIEGGIFLDDFGKAFLLGWIGWHLYTDMVARRVHEANTNEPLLQVFFEEANKIFGGVADGGDDEGGGVSTSQRFGDMFRDARKYGCRLHVITQAPSLLPQDIISSCNNLVIGFLKNPKDKDIALSAIARSEKGFRDEEWRRFLTNQPIGMAIGRFPYTSQRELQQPFLFQPLQLTVAEPTDDEIVRVLGRIPL